MKKTILFASILTFVCQSSVYSSAEYISSNIMNNNAVIVPNNATINQIAPKIVDKSNILITVTKIPQNGESSLIYTGTLDGFSEGILNGIDFFVVDAAIIFDWETDDTYIIKKVNDLIQEQIKPELNDFNNIDIDNNTVQSTTTSSDVGVIEYDIEYEIINDESVSMDIDYNVFNSGTEFENVTLIAALYEDNKLCNIEIKQLNVGTMNSNSENITLQLPSDRDRYSVKLMVWDSIGAMKPLGNVKRIVDLDEYTREKILYITADADVNFNIFMNSSNAKGANNQSTHTIEYDATKISPIDLCGLTYEKELTTTEVQNTNIIINDVDTVLGKIEYKFNLQDGRNTGITNLVKFKTITDITNEVLTYTIQ